MHSLDEVVWSKSLLLGRGSKQAPPTPKGVEPRNAQGCEEASTPMWRSGSEAQLHSLARTTWPLLRAEPRNARGVRSKLHTLVANQEAKQSSTPLPVPYGLR